MTTGDWIFAVAIAWVALSAFGWAFAIGTARINKKYETRFNEPNVGPKASTNCPGIANEVNPIGDVGDFVTPFHDGSDKP